MAFTLRDPRNQWKSVGMRKITSICHNLDGRADRRGRRETQYVSRGTYTQTQRDLGAQLTCPVTQTVYTICTYICKNLTYNTNSPFFAAEMEACSVTQMITLTQCLPHNVCLCFQGPPGPHGNPGRSGPPGVKVQINNLLSLFRKRKKP